ncbi:MAG: hypothetical protein IGR80_15085 [Synechococcales cyanobacterium K44_A2020_017]|jgi:hypothetical protein|nr:hypothetical protein [Synechococcales cyanobacterium K32_A2020_035]MBF2096069.1 hypothetical protein [Synechococcales cyanobacterium K44_A2020_017]
MEATRLNLTTLALTHGLGSALAHGDLDSLHGGSGMISRCPDQATIKNACHLMYERAIALLRINTRAVMSLSVLRCI